MRQKPTINWDAHKAVPSRSWAGAIKRWLSVRLAWLWRGSMVVVTAGSFGVMGNYANHQSPDGYKRVAMQNRPWQKHIKHCKSVVIGSETSSDPLLAVSRCKPTYDFKVVSVTVAKPQAFGSISPTHLQARAQMPVPPSPKPVRMQSVPAKKHRSASLKP